MKRAGNGRTGKKTENCQKVPDCGALLRYDHNA
jgi:hypothetical protein